MSVTQGAGKVRMKTEKAIDGMPETITGTADVHAPTFRAGIISARKRVSLHSDQSCALAAADVDVRGPRR